MFDIKLNQHCCWLSCKNWRNHHCVKKKHHSTSCDN